MPDQKENMQMSNDAHLEEFELVELFGKPTIFTEFRIARDTVPKGLYCYDLRGSDREPCHPVAVERWGAVIHAGTVTMAEPFDFKEKGQRYIRGQLNFLNDTASLEEYIARYGKEITSQQSSPKMKYELLAAARDEPDLFFSGQNDDDVRLGCVGHLRCDFGYRGKEFWPTWFDHIAELNTPAFKEDIQSVIDELRKNGPLKDLNTMAEWCYGHEDAKFDRKYRRDAYGFKVETDAYCCYIRCFPQQGITTPTSISTIKTSSSWAWVR
jgi:hypothetical protein